MVSEMVIVVEIPESVPGTVLVIIVDVITVRQGSQESPRCQLNPEFMGMPAPENPFG